MSKLVITSSAFRCIVRTLVALTLVFYCLCIPCPNAFAIDSVESNNTAESPSDYDVEEIQPEGLPENQAEAQDDAIEQYDSCPYNANKNDVLLSNLIKRFSINGTDSSINTSTIEAAVALYSLGLSLNIDGSKIVDNFVNFEIENGYAPGPGQYAKFIIALEAAGVDCNPIYINGESRFLYQEMDTLIDKDGIPDVYSLVYILPAYYIGNYSSPIYDGLKDKLKDVLLDCQNEEGLFGTSSEWGDDYSSQTTAQAILALYPFQDTDERVRVAIEKAKDKLLSMQRPDGGFNYYSFVPDWEPDLIATTADVICALTCLGIDCTGKDELVVTANGSCPVGFLDKKVDADLAGFTDSVSYDEPSSAAHVLMALAAQSGYTQSDGPYYVYSGSVHTQVQDTLSDTSAKKYLSPRTGEGYLHILFASSLATSIVLVCAIMFRRKFQI